MILKNKDNLSNLPFTTIFSPSHGRLAQQSPRCTLSRAVTYLFDTEDIWIYYNNEGWSLTLELTLFSVFQYSEHMLTFFYISTVSHIILQLIKNVHPVEISKCQKLFWAHKEYATPSKYPRVKNCTELVKNVLYSRNIPGSRLLRAH